MALVAGVIDTTSNYVEHPEVVADRIGSRGAAVGDPRRVIAGTDCGFDTSAGIGDVAPSLVWEKLRALRGRRRPRRFPSVVDWRPAAACRIVLPSGSDGWRRTSTDGTVLPSK